MDGVVVMPPAMPCGRNTNCVSLRQLPVYSSSSLVWSWCEGFCVPRVGHCLMPPHDGAGFACVTDLFGMNGICIYISLKLSKHGFCPLMWATTSSAKRSRNWPQRSLQKARPIFWHGYLKNIPVDYALKMIWLDPLNSHLVSNIRWTRSRSPGGSTAKLPTTQIANLSLALIILGLCSHTFSETRLFSLTPYLKVFVAMIHVMDLSETQ